MKNFENPKIGQNRLFSVKKVDFWTPKVDFRPKMARNRKILKIQKIDFFGRKSHFLTGPALSTRFWPFFRAQYSEMRHFFEIRFFRGPSSHIRKGPRKNRISKKCLISEYWAPKKGDFHFSPKNGILEENGVLKAFLKSICDLKVFFGFFDPKLTLGRGSSAISKKSIFGQFGLLGTFGKFFQKCRFGTLGKNGPCSLKMGPIAKIFQLEFDDILKLAES